MQSHHLTGLREVRRLSPLVRVLTAPNPGMMTGEGTNTYLLGSEDVSVIDPGPAIDSHINTLASLCGDRLKRILVTHTHMDHSPAATLLAARTGAKVIGVPQLPDDGHQDGSFAPDYIPRDNTRIETSEYNLRVLYTPGHVGNHVCYLLEDERAVFVGDHMMNGSTVAIIPPSGDMKAYIQSLTRLKDEKPAVIYPGHGDPIKQACDEIDRLIQHRLTRESKIITALDDLGECSLEELVSVVYDDVDPILHKVAMYSLLAHLLKLEHERRAKRQVKTHWAFGEERWSLV